MVYIRNFINELNITKLVFFGFFIRILFLIFFPQNFGDTQTYLRIGEEIFNGKTVYSDLHMPGYGIWAYILNVFFQSDHGFLIGDVIISSLTIYVIFLISKEIFLDNFISKTSAFLYTIYPYSIFYSVSGLSETLFVFLLFKTPFIENSIPYSSISDKAKSLVKASLSIKRKPFIILPVKSIV